jgi:hypothetical protein
VVDIEGNQMTIERDEEGEYRALMYPDNSTDKKVNKGLIEAVVNVLQAL